MYGYLIYDTLFTLIFYNAVGSLAFVLHHCLGLICCCFGLYFNKMALFGTAIQVFFEGTTPLLHLLGCLKLMGQEGTSKYTALGGPPHLLYASLNKVVLSISIEAEVAATTKLLLSVNHSIFLFGWFVYYMYASARLSSQSPPFFVFVITQMLVDQSVQSCLT